MNAAEHDQTTTSRRRTAWRVVASTLGLLLAVAAGRWVYHLLAPELMGEPNATIPRGRLRSDQSLSNAQNQNGHLNSSQQAGVDQVCEVPALPEGPARADIELRTDISFKPSGGSIDSARYRIIGAYATQEGFTPGRWSMTFDLADSGQGAFYRQLTFDRQSSRIRWSMREGVFSYETVCPDRGERMEFPYSMREGKIFMTTPDDIVLVLEPYAPSEVRELPELP